MRTRSSLLLFVLLGLLAATRGIAQQPSDFTFALTGDSIITRKLTVYNEPAFTRIIDLVRSADVAFTNLEMLFHDYEPYASAASGGTYMRAEPALVKDLVWAGFDMVSRANNHTGDYGVLGMDLTTKYVAEAGLVQAGVGHSLAEAREAKFLEHAKGRVALISVASTFPDSSRAGKTRGDMPARPGLNPLRFETITTVTPQRLADLRQIQAEINGRGGAGAGADAAAATRSTSSVAASSPAPTPGVRTEPQQGRPHRDRGGREERLRARRLHDRHDSRARGRPRADAAGGFPGDLRARDGRRRRRPVRRPRAARAARHRDLQGQADSLQPRRLHLPERDAAAAAERELRGPATSDRRRTSTTSTTRATTSTRAAFRRIG